MRKYPVSHGHILKMVKVGITNGENTNLTYFNSCAISNTQMIGESWIPAITNRYQVPDFSVIT